MKQEAGVQRWLSPNRKCKYIDLQKCQTHNYNTLTAVFGVELLSEASLDMEKTTKKETGNRKFNMAAVNMRRMSLLPVLAYAILNVLNVSLPVSLVFVDIGFVEMPGLEINRWIFFLSCLEAV